MKLSPRITTVASSAVANLCLIPETGGRGRERRRLGAEREEERSKVKALGKWQTHAAESNRCAMTKAGEKDTEVWKVCACMCGSC